VTGSGREVALDPTAVQVDDTPIGPASPGRSGVVARVCRPARAAGRVGALVLAHGGAFCLGDLETDRWRCLLYAQKAGIVVVSVDYGLASEHPFPTALLDMLTALEWLHTQAENLAVDPTRIGIAGESAGAAAGRRDSAAVAQ
jgi:acetyl esterase